MSVERFSIDETGARHFESRGELRLSADGHLHHSTSTEDPLPWSLKLARPDAGDGDGSGGFACTWVEGSRELLVGVPGGPACVALVVMFATETEMVELVHRLGVQILPPQPAGGAAAEAQPTAVFVAASVIEGTGKLTAGAITSAASLFGAGMSVALQSFRTHVSPASEPVVLSRTATTLIDATHSAAAAAEDVTGGVRRGLGSVAQLAGEGVANSLTSRVLAGGGTGALGTTAVTLGSATANALSEVYGAIETSATAVIGSSSGAISGAIGHRYGDQAEAAAAQLGVSAQKASRAVFNASSFGIKALARTTAKQAARGVSSNFAASRAQAVAAEAATGGVSPPVNSALPAAGGAGGSDEAAVVGAVVP
jgi:hypothetical protein